MLNKASWLPLAESLGLKDGGSRRVDHDCGGGRTLKVSREGPKYSAYCWRCNDNGYHVDVESTAERLKRLQQVAASDGQLRAAAARPTGEKDFSKWPLAARLWFLRAGLHGGDAGALHASYLVDADRVLLPCGGDFWQARAIRPGHQPKYMAPLAPKVYPKFGSAERVTLCEDILSTYKVGQVGEAWCMLGTSLPAELHAELLRRGCPVNVWLDNDLPPVFPVNRGQIAARKVLAALRASGIPARNLVTDKDPKLIPYERIKELVS